MMRDDGEILLLYVAPDAARCGAGRGMLASLESQAKSSGIAELHLLSSETAREFYIRHGFSENGALQNLPDGMPGYPMRKLVGIDSP